MRPFMPTCPSTGMRIKKEGSILTWKSGSGPLARLQLREIGYCCSSTVRQKNHNRGQSLPSTIVLPVTVTCRNRVGAKPGVIVRELQVYLLGARGTLRSQHELPSSLG